ncbi:cytochrome c biogenesis protein CcdA [Candidatus Woesearchaeota archaeon]|nr:cytochrome c biogenesis protein CcdA [Candidatus Woesearchaeota archaeon]
MKSKNIFLILALMILLANIAYAQQELPIGLQRLKQHQQELASSITFLLAFFAGLISMTSPCGIALLPTFFSVAFKDRKKAMLMTIAFSIGLLIAFTVFGLIAGFLGNFFNAYKLAFAVVSGFILIFFGILLFFNIGFGIFSFKLDYSKEKSFFSTAMLGFFFGIGWTPCVGPILVGILVLAANASTVLNGTLMLLFYGIGIVVPLIILAYFSDRYDWANSRFLRGKQITLKLFNKQIFTHTYNIIGGILLLIIGLLMIMFKGTFFFQTELPKYVPWSMSFWGYLNERALESNLFTSKIGNVLGIIIGLLAIIFVIWHLNKSENGGKNEIE